MSTVQNVSDETLMLIFRKLDLEDQRKCQKVCRSWYQPAHLIILENIKLPNATKILKFIASIKHNPKPIYLNHVKKIYVANVDATEARTLDNLVVGFTELLYEFRNLRELEISNASPLFSLFNDDMCEKLMIRCPKLKTVKVNDSTNQGEPQLRSLVTELKMGDHSDPVKLAEYTFHIGFPRVQKLTGAKNVLDNFQKLLLFVQRLPALKEVIMSSAVDDLAGFAENSISAKLDHEQDQILKVLSKITRLDLHYSTEAFSINSIKFIKQYLTGLKYLKLHGTHNSKWTDLHRHIFCDGLLDIYCSSDDDSAIRLEHLQFGDTLAILPSITHKVFQSSRKSRFLQLDMTDMLIGSKRMTHMYIDRNKVKNEERVRVMVSKQLGIAGLDTAFFGNLPQLQDVEVFELNIEAKDFSTKINATLDMYDHILQKLPSVKKVFLDFPVTYQDTGLLCSSHPQIKELTLHFTKRIEVETLLNTLFIKFPNLDRLHIHYFSGTWNKYAGEFRLPLQHTKLDFLELDVSPVLSVMRELFPKKHDFFVVEIVSKRKSRWFYVSYDFKNLFETNDLKLRHLHCGIDYYKIRVTMDRVDRVDICLYEDVDATPEIEESYMQCTDEYNVQRLTLFDDSLVVVD